MNLAFALEYSLGHTTHAQNLKRVLEGDGTVRATYVDLPCRISEMPINMNSRSAILSLAHRIKRRMSPTAVKGVREQLGKTGLLKRWSSHFFEDNLQLLNDTLAEAGLENDYFLLGGLLLGWARERKILGHDRDDADFGFLRDAAEMEFALTASLERAGFTLFRKWVNNAGNTTELVFGKDNCHFEFFAMQATGQTIQHFEYGNGCQTLNISPWNGLEEIEFLGRRWMKPANHDAYLASTYGDWHTPVRDWIWYRDDKSITSSEQWEGHVLELRYIGQEKEWVPCKE